MGTILQNVAARVLRGGHGRRHGANALRRALACDVLEGRQLLSWGGAGALGLGRGMAAHLGHARGGHALGMAGHRVGHMAYAPGMMATPVMATPASTSNSPSSSR